MFLRFKMSHIQKSEKIYHGCFTKNKDGTNTLIKKGENCVCPTNNPFWKYPEDVDCCVRTCSQENKNKKKIPIKSLINTLKNILTDGYLQTSTNTYFETILSVLFIATFLVLFIVNKGNILTDGRRYRKRPRI